MNAAQPKPLWPANPKPPAPTMTWAEMAKAEGHGKGLPNNGPSMGVRRADHGPVCAAITKFLKQNPRSTATDIGNAIGESRQYVTSILTALKLEGVVKREGRSNIQWWLA